MLSLDAEKLKALRAVVGDELLEQLLSSLLSANVKQHAGAGHGVALKDAPPAGPLPLSDVFDAVFGGTTPDDHCFQGEEWS